MHCLVFDRLQYAKASASEVKKNVKNPLDGGKARVWLIKLSLVPKPHFLEKNCLGTRVIGWLLGAWLEL